MKPIASQISASILPFAVGALLIVAASCVTGCNTISYEKDGTKISCKRAFWNTESYVVELNPTNGAAKLEVNKSGVDAKAITDIITATATAAGNALKP
jgi:hypothetical protein